MAFDDEEDEGYSKARTTRSRTAVTSPGRQQRRSKRAITPSNGNDSRKAARTTSSANRDAASASRSRSRSLEEEEDDDDEDLDRKPPALQDDEDEEDDGDASASTQGRRRLRRSSRQTSPPVKVQDSNSNITSSSKTPGQERRRISRSSTASNKGGKSDGSDDNNSDKKPSASAGASTPTAGQMRELQRLVPKEEEGRLECEVRDEFGDTLLQTDAILEPNKELKINPQVARFNRDWEDRFFELLVFKKAYGHLHVPKMFVENPALGRWVVKQRSWKKKNDPHLTPFRLRRLNAAGFVWDPKSHPDFWKIQSSNVKSENLWEENFQMLIDYKRENGHCLVPKEFPPNPRLARWVTKQRKHYKAKREDGYHTLDDEKERRLVEIGFVFNTKTREMMRDSVLRRYEDRFEYFCNKLIAFKEEFHHAAVPRRWKRDKQLASWVMRQRNQWRRLENGEHSYLTEARLQRLQEIGFVFGEFDRKLYPVNSPDEKEIKTTSEVSVAKKKPPPQEAAATPNSRSTRRTRSSVAVGGVDFLDDDDDDDDDDEKKMDEDIVAEIVNEETLAAGENIEEGEAEKEEEEEEEEAPQEQDEMEVISPQVLQESREVEEKEGAMAKEKTQDDQQDEDKGKEDDTIDKKMLDEDAPAEAQKEVCGEETTSKKEDAQVDGTAAAAAAAAGTEMAKQDMPSGEVEKMKEKEDGTAAEEEKTNKKAATAKQDAPSMGEKEDAAEETGIATVGRKDMSSSGVKEDTDMKKDTPPLDEVEKPKEPVADNPVSEECAPREEETAAVAVAKQEEKKKAADTAPPAALQKEIKKGMWKCCVCDFDEFACFVDASAHEAACEGMAALALAAMMQLD